MGYGPLVRASTGITHLWSSKQLDSDAPPAFCDTVTVFPDHVVSRIAAIATLAALIGRDQRNIGAHVHVSQAEAAINQLDSRYAAEAASARGLSVDGDLSIHSVCPCAEGEEWCVISIRGEDDWRALSTIIGLSGAADGMRWATAESRRERREELINIVSQWTRVRSATAVAELLQGVGVAAAEVNRATDVLRDPQVLHRGLYAEMAHPLVDIPLPSETGPAPYRNIPRADLRPAPLLGEHTRDICQQMLGLDVEQIDRLIDERVLFAPQMPSPVGRSTTSCR